MLKPGARDIGETAGPNYTSLQVRPDKPLLHSRQSTKKLTSENAVNQDLVP